MALLNDLITSVGIIQVAGRITKFKGNWALNQKKILYLICNKPYKEQYNWHWKSCFYNYNKILYHISRLSLLSTTCQNMQGFFVGRNFKVRFDTDTYYAIMIRWL